MTRRRLVLLIPPLFLLAGYLALWCTKPTRITAGDFRAVRIGMTVAEVLAVVRVPPGDYRSIQNQQESPGVSLVPPPGNRSPATPEAVMMRWKDDDGEFIIYESDGRVAGFGHISERDETFLERLRGWLGL